MTCVAPREGGERKLAFLPDTGAPIPITQRTAASQTTRAG